MYAILEDGKVSKFGSLSELFPSVSFAASGPDKEWLTLNNVTDVEMTMPYNQDTEELVYLDAPKVTKGGKVIGVEAKKLSDENAWARIKMKRNDLLTKTDWTQLADTLTPEMTKKYAEYRTALRDITSAKSPSDVIWPEDPAKGA
jgi:hypothetical protein